MILTWQRLYQLLGVDEVLAHCKQIIAHLMDNYLHKYIIFYFVKGPADSHYKNLTKEHTIITQQ